MLRPVLTIRQVLILREIRRFTIPYFNGPAICQTQETTMIHDGRLPSFNGLAFLLESTLLPRGYTDFILSIVILMPVRIFRLKILKILTRAVKKRPPGLRWKRPRISHNALEARGVRGVGESRVSHA